MKKLIFVSKVFFVLTFVLRERQQQFLIQTYLSLNSSKRLLFKAPTGFLKSR